MCGCVEVGRLLRSVALFNFEAWIGSGLQISKKEIQKKDIVTRKRTYDQQIGKPTEINDEIIRAIERRLTFMKQLPGNVKITNISSNDNVAKVLITLGSRSQLKQTVASQQKVTVFNIKRLRDTLQIHI